MADLTADSAELAGAGTSIVDIANGLVSVGATAEQAMQIASEAVSHPQLQGAIDEAQAAARTAHQVLFDGVSRLGSFSTSSGDTFAQSDRDLANLLAGGA